MPHVIPPSQSDRPGAGFMGERQSGKSTVSAALRRLAGSYSCAASDIEYSDPMIESANLALDGQSRYGGSLEAWLLRAVSVVLQRHVPCPADEGWTQRNVRAKQIRQDLYDWWSSVPPSTRLDRDTKDTHRAPLIWLGINIRHLMGEDVWAREIDRRISYVEHSRLITVGGVRFPSDDVPVRQLQWPLFTIRSRRTPEDDDPTNANRFLLKPDVVVFNNGPVESVPELAAAIWQDWQQGWLAEQYGEPN